MKFTKFVSMTLAAAFFAISLSGPPVSAHAHETPSGTGKTLGAVIVVAAVDANTQATGAGDDLSGMEAQAQQADTGDVEWKYVPVRRTSG